MAMDVKNGTSLVVGTLHGAVPGGDALTVVVKGTFDLVEGGRARAAARTEADVLTGDLGWDDEPRGSCRYPSDFAPFKPQGEVLLVGHFTPVANETRTHTTLTLRLGAVEKSIVLIGDRHFRESSPGVFAMSEPRPLGRIPLGYERAFGGAAVATNPVGRGSAAPFELPNLEDPRSLVTAPHDRPNPACFAPLAPGWPQRIAKAGTYDEAWQATRWPRFPSDFDWAYFNSAPADQLFAGYLRGDETYLLEGFGTSTRGTADRRRGTLPGVRPRVFARRRSRDVEARFEVPLVLDTAWFDVDTKQVVLVWRGHRKMSADEARAVEQLLVVEEDLLASPLPAEAYDTDPRWHATEEATEGLQEEAGLESTTDLTTIDEPAPSPTPPTNDDVETLATARRMLAEAKVSPDLLARLEGLSSIPSFLAVLERDLPTPDPDLTSHEAAQAARGREYLGKLGQDAATFEQNEPEIPAPPPGEREGALTRDEVLELHRAGESLAERDLRGLDLSALDLAGATLTGARLDGASLSGTRLVGADLSHASLVRVKASGAVLDDVVAESVKVAGADLTRASLARANLASADATGINLTAATLDDADLEGAKLTGATLVEASLAFANLTRADLSSAKLERARGAGLDLREAILDDAVASDADLTGANLTGASLVRANLAGVLLDGATLERVRASRVTLTAARLHRAKLGHGADLERAALDRIQADEAVFANAKLVAASFEGATLERSTFREALAEGATFHLAKLRGADFTATQLRGARLTQANLFEARLGEADLTSADCRGSNLYGADLLDTKLAGTRLDDVLLGATRLAKRDA